MFASLFQGVGRLLAVMTIPLFASTAFAQWGGFGGLCHPCGRTAAVAPQYAAAPIAYTPYAQTACVCPCMQPLTETVYREVPVTEYRAVKKTVQRPVLKTVYEDRPVTAYRQVMEQRTAEVPTVSYQTVQEFRPMTINQSYWQTVHQPVTKMSPCYYDSRPGLLGWMNRTSYDLRMAFTPNIIRRRQFVPNVRTVNVPYHRAVAIPGTRQVTYNVAKMEPYETTQRVAVQKLINEEVEVTAYEPHTVTKTVAVGNQTRWAYVDPFGGSRATASEPTPAARSAERNDSSQTSTNNNIQRQNYQRPASQTIPNRHAPPPIPQTPTFDAEPQPLPAGPAEEESLFFNMDQGSTGREGVSSSHVAGWRASRRVRLTVAKPQSNGPDLLPMVAAN